VEEVIDIGEMKSKSITELHKMAMDLNLNNFAGLRKQDLIFMIEQNLLDNNVVLRGEGVLEILPEGYGFLRSQDWNYFYGPDDKLNFFGFFNGSERLHQPVHRNNLEAGLVFLQ